MSEGERGLELLVLPKSQDSSSLLLFPAFQPIYQDGDDQQQEDEGKEQRGIGNFWEPDPQTIPRGADLASIHAHHGNVVGSRRGI